MTEHEWECPDCGDVIQRPAKQMTASAWNQMKDDHECYPTWTEDYELHGRELTREKFECDCGNDMVVQPMTECKQCGAHYEYRDGEVVQVAPPIPLPDGDDELASLGE